MKVNIKIKENSDFYLDTPKFMLKSEHSRPLIDFGRAGLKISNKNLGLSSNNLEYTIHKYDTGGNFLNPNSNFSDINIDDLFVDIDVEPSKYEKSLKNLKSFSPNSGYIPDYETPLTKKSTTKTSSDTSSTNTNETNTASWLTSPYSLTSGLTRNKIKSDTPIYNSEGVNVSDLDSAVERYLKMGLKYGLGHNGSDGLIDCSNFTRSIMQDLGYDVKGTAHNQYLNSDRVDAKDVQPGDLVFLQGTNVKGGVPWGRASHVGVVLDASDIANGNIVVADMSSQNKQLMKRTWNINEGWSGGNKFFGFGRPKKLNS